MAFRPKRGVSKEKQKHYFEILEKIDLQKLIANKDYKNTVQDNVISDEEWYFLEPRILQ